MLAYELPHPVIKSVMLGEWRQSSLSTASTYFIHIFYIILCILVVMGDTAISFSIRYQVFFSRISKYRVPIPSTCVSSIGYIEYFTSKYLPTCNYFHSY